jgi:hypothetical protein
VIFIKLLFKKIKCILNCHSYKMDLFSKQYLCSTTCIKCFKTIYIKEIFK